MQYIFDDNIINLQYKLKSIESALDTIIFSCKHHKKLAFDVEDSFYDKELYDLDPDGFHENCLEIFKDISYHYTWMETFGFPMYILWPSIL